MTYFPTVTRRVQHNLQIYIYILVKMIISNILGIISFAFYLTLLHLVFPPFLKKVSKIIIVQY